MLPRPIVAVVLWSLVALALSAQVAAAERRVALVLGNSAYRAAGLALANPRNDAEDVATALKRLGFDVHVARDADRAATDRAIETFARDATDADAALFYYAGHALQYHGRNYLLPIDADVRDEIGIELSAVAVDTIRRLLDRIRGIKIMVLDACRDNPIARNLAENLTENLADARAATRLAATGLAARAIDRGDKSERLIVAYAASPDAIALDGQGRNSPFATAFLRRLDEAGLEVELMFRKIAADVDAVTRGRQRPVTFVSRIGEYYLNQNDRIAWEQIEGKDDAAALRDFLERFPSSYYALEARYKLQALERAIANAQQRREADRRAAEQRACEADQAKLAALADDDEGALHVLAATTPCTGVRLEAARRADAAVAARIRKAELCRREAEQIESLAQTAGREAIADLRRRATCSGSLAVLDRRAAVITAATEAACTRDAAALAKVAGARDADGLRALVGTAACAAVKADARQRLATLEGLLATEKAACDRDAAALGKIGPRDADGLRALVGTAACAAVKADARQRLATLEGLLATEKAACDRDAAALAKVAGARDADGLRALVGTAACDAVKADARQRLATLDGLLATEKAACDRDAAALGKIGARDADGLRALVGTAACAAVKADARQRLATLEGLLATEKAACDRDAAAWAKVAGARGRAQAEALRKKVECPAVLARIDAALADLLQPTQPEPVNTKAQVRAAQAELARLGCFAGQPNGKLDQNTEKGVKRYFEANGKSEEAVAKVRITDAVVVELKQHAEGLCVPSSPIIARPEPAPEAPQKKDKVIVARPPKPAPEQARKKPPRPPVAVVHDTPRRPPAAGPSSRPQRLPPAAPVAAGGGVRVGGGGQGGPVTGIGF
jgi:hypothetical protein